MQQSNNASMIQNMVDIMHWTKQWTKHDSNNKLSDVYDNEKMPPIQKKNPITVSDRIREKGKEQKRTSSKNSRLRHNLIPLATFQREIR